jgi:hypothetical protein
MFAREIVKLNLADKSLIDWMFANLQVSAHSGPRNQITKTPSQSRRGFLCFWIYEIGTAVREKLGC